MDAQAFDMGIWLGAAVVVLPVSALIAFVVVFRREALIIDGRLITKARQDAFEAIASHNCRLDPEGDTEALEDLLREIAIDCIANAYLTFNPAAKTPIRRLRKRFNANVIVIGNSAITRLYFGKQFDGGAELGAINIPIDREIALKRPADIAPNGGGLKTKPAPVKPPTPAAASQKPAPKQQAGRPQPRFKAT